MKFNCMPYVKFMKSFFVVADFHNIQLDKRVKTAIAEIYWLSVFLYAFAALALTFRFHPIATRSKMSMTRQTIDDECTLFFSRFTSRCTAPHCYAGYLLQCKTITHLPHEFQNSAIRKWSVIAKLFSYIYLADMKHNYDREFDLVNSMSCRLKDLQYQTKISPIQWKIIIISKFSIFRWWDKALEFFAKSFK